MLTLKHVNNQLETKPNTCPTCKKCNKEYKTNSGVWKHEKTCKISTPITIQKLIDTNKELTQIIINQQRIILEKMN